jgi:hypothetical protein
VRLALVNIALIHLLANNISFRTEKMSTLITTSIPPDNFVETILNMILQNYHMSANKSQSYHVHEELSIERRQLINRYFRLTQPSTYKQVMHTFFSGGKIRSNYTLFLAFSLEIERFVMQPKIERQQNHEQRDTHDWYWKGPSDYPEQPLTFKIISYAEKVQQCMRQVHYRLKHHSPTVQATAEYWKCKIRENLSDLCMEQTGSSLYQNMLKLHRGTTIRTHPIVLEAIKEELHVNSDDDIIIKHQTPSMMEWCIIPTICPTPSPSYKHDWDERLELIDTFSTDIQQEFRNEITPANTTDTFQSEEGRMQLALSLSETSEASGSTESPKRRPESPANTWFPKYYRTY